jgi:hypothetical protein
MTPAELMAEEMFFQNVCDIVENETETGTTFGRLSLVLRRCVGKAESNPEEATRQLAHVRRIGLEDTDQNALIKILTDFKTNMTT